MRRAIVGALLAAVIGCASGNNRPAVVLPDTREAKGEAAECDQKHDKCLRERMGHDPSYCDSAYRRCYMLIPGANG